MQVTVTEGARNYLANEARGVDVAIFVFQLECLCVGIRPNVFCRSKAEVNPVFLNAYFEEVANIDGIPVFLDRRLRNHFESYGLTIDIEDGLRVKGWNPR